jgi:glycosyltransferase involved in cell wall biosynthesis
VTVARIDQVIPSLASRDAIGGHTLQLRDLLREKGLPVGHLLRQRLPRPTRLRAAGEPARGPVVGGRVLLYQLSIGSGVADIFRQCSERKFVNYHNITPADLLEAGCRPWVKRCGGAGPSSAIWRPSPSSPSPTRPSTNASCKVAGYRSTTTVPLLIDLDGFAGTPDVALASRLAAQKAGGGADLLFVGKVSPHKGQHDLVKALAAYRRLYDPRRPAAPGGRRHQRRVPTAGRAVRRRAGTGRRDWTSPDRSPTRS